MIRVELLIETAIWEGVKAQAVARGMHPDELVRQFVTGGVLALEGPSQEQIESEERLAAEERAVELGEPYPCYQAGQNLPRDCPSDGYYLCEGCGRLQPQEVRDFAALGDL